MASGTSSNQRYFESAFRAAMTAALLEVPGRAAEVLDDDAAILPRRALRVHLEVLLAVALGLQVLRRHAEGVGQHHRHRFRPAVGQRQIVDV